MKYSEIENKKQYSEYCNRHLEVGRILATGKSNPDLKDEYYILDLIISDYTKKQTNPFEKLTPVDLLKALMLEHNYSGFKLSKELKISQSIISDILNYKRGFSKDVILKLANLFELSPVSFLKKYELIHRENNVA